jgi:hypothetical protein
MPSKSKKPAAEAQLFLVHPDNARKFDLRNPLIDSENYFGNTASLIELKDLYALHRRKSELYLFQNDYKINEKRAIVIPQKKDLKQLPPPQQNVKIGKEEIEDDQVVVVAEKKPQTQQSSKRKIEADHKEEKKIKTSPTSNGVAVHSSNSTTPPQPQPSTPTTKGQENHRKEEVEQKIGESQKEEQKHQQQQQIVSHLSHPKNANKIIPNNPLWNAFNRSRIKYMVYNSLVSPTTAQSAVSEMTKRATSINNLQMKKLVSDEILPLMLTGDNNAYDSFFTQKDDILVYMCQKLSNEFVLSTAMPITITTNENIKSVAYSCGVSDAAVEIVGKNNSNKKGLEESSHRINIYCEMITNSYDLLCYINSFFPIDLVHS